MRVGGRRGQVYPPPSYLIAFGLRPRNFSAYVVYQSRWYSVELPAREVAFLYTGWCMVRAPMLRHLLVVSMPLMLNHEWAVAFARLGGKVHIGSKSCVLAIGKPVVAVGHLLLGEVFENPLLPD